MVLIQLGKGQINEWKCTSSHAGGQQRGDQHTKGGLIPPRSSRSQLEAMGI